MTRLCLLAALLAGAMAPLLSAQTAAGAGSIDGTVLNGGGAPLDRAELTLSTAGDQGTQLAETVTGPTGRFHFGNLASGKYRLEASRRGYVTAAYQEHEQGYFTAVVVGPGLDSHGVQFRLLPEGIIGGVVTDDAGEPVGGAQVTLYREDRATGTDKVVQAGAEITDDSGAYEFARRKPGTFFVAVSASPWYAMHPQQKTDPDGNPLPADQQPRSPLDVAYPMTFYANATDSDAATPIPLNAGDHLQVNFSLHAVPAIHIQVRLPGPSGGGRGIAMPQLGREVFGTEQFVPMGGGISMSGSRNGSMTEDLGGIAPGNYVLRQFGPESEQGHTASLDLTSDQTVDYSSAASSGVDVTGKVEMANGGKLPRRSTISLASTESQRDRKSASVANDGTFALHSVAPGTYDVEVSGSGTTLAALQMAASGAETDGNHVTIGDNSVLLAATLVSGSATVTGYVKHAGKGFGGALVLLVPAGAKPNHDLYRLDQSDSDGSFTLNRVFPGNYTLVAIDGGWTLDWAHPEVIASYLTRGLKVQVTTQRSLDLADAVEVQPR